MVDKIKFLKLTISANPQSLGQREKKLDTYRWKFRNLSYQSRLNHRKRIPSPCRRTEYQENRERREITSVVDPYENHASDVRKLIMFSSFQVQDNFEIFVEKRLNLITEILDC